MKKPIYKKWWFWLVIVIVFIGIVGGSQSNKDKDKPTNETSTSSDTTKGTKTEDKKEEGKITYDNFLKIEMGQKYSDVIALLGEGTEQSSSEIGGIKSIIYTWKGSDLLSNMTVTIQNDAVTGKAQSGLNENNSDITMDKYSQVKEGMTYDEVKNLLGDGVITSQTKIMGSESIIYSYIKKGGSNATLTFSDNKLMSKAQFGLE